MAESLNPLPQPPGGLDPAVAKKGVIGSPRSPSQELLRYFKFDHLPAPLREISGYCSYAAHEMERMLPDGPEKTMGLRKLLEAKDCFVRAALPKEGPAYIGKSNVDIEVECVKCGQQPGSTRPCPDGDSRHSWEL